MFARSRGRPRTYRPSLEPLEDRIQLAASVTSTLGADGTLTVEGTDGPDNIAFWAARGYLGVVGVTTHTPTGPAAWVPVAQVQRIVVNGDGGDDRVTLDQTRYGSDPIRLPATITGGSGNDYLVGDQGNDLIVGGDGNDTLVGRGAHDTLVGGAGNDLLFAGGGSGVLDGGAGVNFFDRGTGNPTLVKSGTLDFVADQWAAGGAQPQDVVQQYAPTCSFLAALASDAGTGSTDLAGGITYLGNCMYGVRLFAAGATAGAGKWVTEDVTFNGGLTASDPQPVSAGKFWTVLYQRAWIALRASQGLSDVAWPGDALTALTGQSAYVLPGSNAWYFFQTLYYGFNVVCSTNLNLSALGGTLVANHAYTVMGLDSAGNILLRNPWGFDGGQTASGDPNDGVIALSWADFARSMAAYWIC
jgi:hypothetical protein